MDARLNRAGRRWLDPRAWLLWALAASLPPLLGRNPWVLAATLLAVLGVRAAWADVAERGAWRGLVRLAAVVLAIGVFFNALTVHAGDRVLVRLPAGWPLVGGPLTANALVYGVLAAAATLTLILVGVTLGAALDWAAVLRLLPQRMTGLAVAGAIAWGLVPQTVVAFGQIREAQMARGLRPARLRDAVPLLAPLLGGGLERAFSLAEALEARGFGSRPPDAAGPGRYRLPLAGGAAVAGIVGGYLLAVGVVGLALAFFGLALVALRVALAEPADSRTGPRRTRYRDPVWGREEWIVAGGAIGAIAVIVVGVAIDLTAFAYLPYPTLAPPPIDLPLLAGLGFLLAPALVAP